MLIHLPALHVFLSSLTLFAIHAHAATNEIDPKTVHAAFGDFVKPLIKDEAALKKSVDLITLGRTLFYDTRLSQNETISCNDCHDLAKYGVNGDHYLSQRGTNTIGRDVPTLYNLNSHLTYGWDGSHKTLHEQTLHAIQSEREMAMNDTDALERRLSAVSAYASLFKKAFPNTTHPITISNVVIALTRFEEGLVTPAPFDAFLLGDTNALTQQQLKGALAFDGANCAACHTGSGFGGQMLQKLGTVRPWPNRTDLGYYHVTKDPAHKMIFRVAPLRNSEMTAPYFHDRSSKRLWDAVRKMAQYEAGRNLDVDTILNIQAFLKSLTGPIPAAYIKRPANPE